MNLRQLNPLSDAQDPRQLLQNRIMMPVSKDALLWVARRRVAEQDDELSVIGINDFAFRRGQTYGTIVSDLKRRRPVALLPDRVEYVLELARRAPVDIDR